MSDRPHVRTELPWLRSGPIHKIHTSAVGEMDALIERAGYLRIDLDGRAMTSRAAAHAEIGRAFGFPDWYGPSWDGFNDCMGHFVIEHDGALVAVVIHDVEAAAAAAPVSAIEVGWGFLEVKFGVIPTLGAGQTATIELDLYMVGSGPDFDRPDGVGA
ncbi:barstar family protein [Nocardioides hwasunensis]|uniref:Barstar family protein n=1 Tax=Nocardioides hwasunensis TaxID=397258 RepID=A0ABR8MAM3_9ACTN|nr:barstar family protein [Nocardioides hwasunensis]MBD3913209.1 barstar family protein [Nocardioides hwasunensis]